MSAVLAEPALSADDLHHEPSAEEVYLVYGILVNTMGPGRIYTDRIKYLNKIRGEKLGMTEEEYTAKDSAAFPQRRYQTPEEYGRMATFLISPANGCMSGQAFIFDGAMTTSY